MHGFVRNLAVLCLAACVGSGAALAHVASEHAHPAQPAAADNIFFGAPGSASNGTRAIAIHMSDAMCFSPAALTVGQGDTIHPITSPTMGKLAHEFVLGTPARSPKTNR